MSKRLKTILLLLSINVLSVAQIKFRLQVDTSLNEINPNIYGFLLEHIYHSVSNGIWGEDVWNRSFEEVNGLGNWSVSSEGEAILKGACQPLSYIHIGRGKNYEVEFDAMQSTTTGQLMMGVRDQHRDDMLINRVFWYPGCRLDIFKGWVWYRPKVDSLSFSLPDNTVRPHRWIHLKMRCQGNKLTCWVDGRKCFEKDVDGIPQNGDITVGGCYCDAVFKNFTIRDLRGHEMQPNLDLFRHWQMKGSGIMQVDHNHPLNDHTAVKLDIKRKQMGIEQSAYMKSFQRDTLSGSVWLRGTCKQVKVVLRNNNRILASQTIRLRGKHWKEYPLTLSSDFDTDTLVLGIYGNGKGQLWIDQISLMSNSSVRNDGFREDLTYAVTRLHPALLRWPGGSFSEQYHFEHGLGQQKDRIGIRRWDDYDPLSVGTDELMTFCKKTGAEPVIVVPIGYHNYKGYSPGKEDWLQRAMDWMDYCNGDENTIWGKRRMANGHQEPYKVKYWEIDNEVWKMNPQQYVSLTRKFATAMKHRYPYVKIIACGCGRLGKEGTGLDSMLIFQDGDVVDYISPHYYQVYSRFDRKGVDEYGEYLDQLSRWISQSSNPDMKIYLSEWNLEGIDMRTGLFAGGLLNRLESTPAVQMAAGALLLRHTSAPGWNNAFINFDRRGWFGAPNYVVFELWRQHYLPYRVQLFSDTTELNTIATASLNRDTVCIKIVNTEGKTYRASIDNCGRWPHAILETVSGTSLDDKNSMEQPEKIKARRRKVQRIKDACIIEIPPFSANVLTLKR